MRGHLTGTFVRLVLISLLGLSAIGYGNAGEWVEKAKMPTARRSAAAVALDGKIYVIGGAAGNWNALSALEEYDPVENKWTKKANMLTPRFRFDACAVNGRIYAIGGTSNDVGSGVFANTEEYDPATDKWTKKADMPTARHSLTATVVDGKIYAIGGAKGSMVLETPVGFDTVEEYDPVTDKWTKKADTITPRYGHGACVVRDKIYIAGGAWGAQKPAETTNAVEEYDPVKNKWTEKTKAQNVRLYLNVNAANSMIYVIGGLADLGAIDALSSMDEYNPATNLWTKKLDMLTPKTSAASDVVNGKIYVFGGWLGWIKGVNGVVLSTVEEYIPDGWSVSPQDKLASTWAMIKASR